MVHEMDGDQELSKAHLVHMQSAALVCRAVMHRCTEHVRSVKEGGVLCLLCWPEVVSSTVLDQCMLALPHWQEVTCMAFDTGLCGVLQWAVMPLLAISAIQLFTETDILNSLFRTSPPLPRLCTVVAAPQLSESGARRPQALSCLRCCLLQTLCCIAQRFEARQSLGYHHHTTFLQLKRTAAVTSRFTRRDSSTRGIRSNPWLEADQTYEPDSLAHPKCFWLGKLSKFGQASFVLLEPGPPAVPVRQISCHWLLGLHLAL
jgi:hypothetical protein